MQLSRFLGTWMMEGRMFAGPFTQDASVRARETYEYLPGEKFLIHRIDGMLGDSPMSCIDVTGLDGPMRAFYIDGTQRDFVVQQDGNVFTYAREERAPDGVTYHNRCRMQFVDAKTRDATWEHSRDGKTWTVYWRNVAKRVD
jgi:hypothetical protein